MSESAASAQEQRLIAESTQKIGAVAMSRGWKVPIGNSLWTSSLYKRNIFPKEGTPVETTLSLPSKEYQNDWLETASVEIRGEEVLSLGDPENPIAPLLITLGLENVSDDPDAVGGFDIFYDVFPDRVERHALAVLGPKTTLEFGEQWFRDHGVARDEVAVSRLEDDLPLDISVTRIPAQDFAEIVTGLVG